VRIWAFEDLPLLDRPLSVVQGTKDEFGSIDEVKAVIERAVPAGRIYEVDGASHLFPGRTKEAAARVVEAVEDRFAAPSIALFTERATLLRIVTGPSDQLARELSAKRVVIDPAPAWLLGLLGGAAVAAMAGRAATALASMLPQTTRDRASAFAQRAGTAMRDSGAHPFALLGFDPIELWQRLKHHYR
jgi:hypothetical protein